jgi:hypothetical protein
VNKTKGIAALFIFLLTSLSITGISLLDNHIWNLIIMIISIVAYFIVGIMYSWRLILTSSQGKSVYALILVVLALCVYALYSAIVKFQEWVLSWPKIAHIIVPIALALLSVVIGALIIVKKCNHKKKQIVKEGKNENSD